MRWALTSDQFAFAWEATGLDHYPYPLRIRLAARTGAERTSQLVQLRQWSRVALDGDLQVALRTLEKSDSRVEVFGLLGTRAVRVVAAAVGGTAAVAAQSPGGDVRLSLCRIDAMVDCIVAAMPPAQPGSAGECSAPLTDVRQDSRDVFKESPTAKSVAGQIRRVLKRPRDGIGQIIATGRPADSVHRSSHVLCWIDVSADGRYLVRTRDDVDLIPATPCAFQRELLRIVDDSAH